MPTQESVDQVSKVLGEPVMAETHENGLKIRRNLLVASVIGCFMVWGGVHIKSDPTIFGLQFSGVTDLLFSRGLLLLIVYFFLHFLWYVVDGYYQWRIRITGTKQAYVTTGLLADEHGDYTDPYQSTLYNWWKGQSKSITTVQAFMHQWTVKVASQMENLDGLLQEENKGLRPAGQSIAAIHNVASHCRDSLGRIEVLLDSPRIVESLRRFDNHFRFLLVSQNLRWLVLESIVPLATGMLAILLLLFKTT